MTGGKLIEFVVTVIIPTYNRPEMLRVCIKGVLNQTIKNWKLIVIGDSCDDSTGKVIAEFNDQRITYYNNPFRFGEQGGGNSIGIALAETEYIAFLNHDDIWLPNHLEVSINSLEEGNSDFYIGTCLISEEIDRAIPVFKTKTNSKRKPYWIFTARYGLFEPSSSWVLKTTLAKKTKYWKQSHGLHRYPIQEYLMRVWRQKAKFEFGSEITCIRPLNHSKDKSSIYLKSDIRINYFNQLVNNENLLTTISQNKNLTEVAYTKNYRIGSNKIRGLVYNLTHDLFVNKLTAYLFYLTGIDSYNILNDLFFIRRGEKAKNLINKRTGEKLPYKYNMTVAVETAMKTIQSS